MQDFLRWLADLKGIRVEPGTDLQFELTGFPSGGLGLLTILGILFAVFLIAFVYRRDGRNLSVAQKVTLATLRGLAVLAAFLVVLEPNIVSVKKDVRDGHAIILMDLSQSMGHRDAFRRDEVQQLVQSWGEFGQKDLPNTTRFELAKAILAHDDFALIKKLNEKNKVLLYGFSAGLQLMPLVAIEPTQPSTDPNKTTKAGADPVDPEAKKRVPPEPDLEAIHADGKYSNIGGAIRTALQKSRDASIAAVILLTDGRRNIGAKGAEVSRFLTQRKVDHTLIVGIGDPSEAQSVSISGIEAPERAFQKDPFKIRSSVTSQGYDAMTLTARLIQLPEGDGSGTVVQTKQVPITREQQEVDLEFENITVDQPGIRNYRVEIEPPTGEPIVRTRHGKQARVEILAEKTKVLLIAGAPLHEYQILRQLLTRDNTIELSCWLESADANFMQDGNLNLKKLPDERKDLEPYDVFIFMDPDPNLLDREFCEMVANQIKKNGSGMWWVCGEKYTLDALSAPANTAPITDLLPVWPNMDVAKLIIGLRRGFGRTYPFELTAQGRNHQTMRLVDSGKDENDIMWGQLPGWHFTFPVKRAKKGARVLAATNASSRFRESEETMPIFATHYVGTGRVLFSGTDETYRWRSLFEDQYNRFWVKGIRYLYEGRLNAGRSRLRIDISGQKLELGEPLKVTVQAENETYGPLIAESLSLQIIRENEPPTNLELSSVENEPGQFDANFRPPKTGFYRIVPIDKEAQVEARFQVVAAAVEKEGPVDLAELGAVASADGGRLLATPSELLTAAGEIPSRLTIELFKTPHAMWDSWITIAVIVTLLAAEWWLRKLWNLL